MNTQNWVLSLFFHQKIKFQLTGDFAEIKIIFLIKRPPLVFRVSFSSIDSKNQVDSILLCFMNSINKMRPLGASLSKHVSTRAQYNIYFCSTPVSYFLANVYSSIMMIV